ncbi:MAG: transketolase [Candidatus Methylomirabilia bacterium]
MALYDKRLDIEVLSRMAREVRATCVQMAHDGKEGHLSSSMSQAGLLVALYNAWLRVDPANPRAPDRDRFFLSKGHACASLYAVLAQRGFLPMEALREYNREEGPLPNHPCVHALPLLEASSGSLGQALGIATGVLYALRLKGGAGRVAVLMGDGECNEGSVWEAAMFAAAHKLDRLLTIVDYNGIQAVGRSDDIMGQTCLEEKFRAFGWAARVVDGSSMREIVAALDAVPFEPGRPSAIVARTRTGVSFMDGSVLWHYRKPDAEDLEKALAELGERPLHLRGDG